jgi:hypothetical protein
MACGRKLWHREMREKWREAGKSKAGGARTGRAEECAVHIEAEDFKAGQWVGGGAGWGGRGVTRAAIARGKRVICAELI